MLVNDTAMTGAFKFRRRRLQNKIEWGCCRAPQLHPPIKMSWPPFRAKNFLKYLNERGYTDVKPTNHEENLKALAEHIAVPFETFMAMNPIAYGLKAFLPQHANEVLCTLLGSTAYVELVELHYTPKKKSVSFYGTRSKSCLPSSLSLTAEELSIARTLMQLSSC